MATAEEYRAVRIKQIVDKYGYPGAGDDYDPNLYRDTPNPTTYFETLAHVMKGCLGTGLLAMPLAFKYSGMLASVIASILITIICTYGIQIFFRSQYTVCKKFKTRYMPYPLVMKVALLSGPMIFTRAAVPLSSIVDGFLILYQIGVGACYIIFMAANIKDVYEVNHTDEQKRGVEIYMLILFIPLFLIASVPNLKVMAKFSLLSNILMFIASVIMIVVMARDLPTISERRATGKIEDFPLTFGITLFAISSMGIMLTVEKGMKKPEQMVRWWGTLNVAMFFICIIYTFIGFFGFWRFGEDVKDSITLNLNEISKTEGGVVQVLYVIAIFFTYGLNSMVPVNLIWAILDERLAEWKYHDYGPCFTRIFVVTASMICATCIPLFGDMISLLGAFGMSCLELIFPSLIHMCANWPNDLGPKKWILFIDIVVFIIGIFGMVAGTYASINKIIENLKKLRGS